MELYEIALGFVGIVVVVLGFVVLVSGIVQTVANAMHDRPPVERPTLDVQNHLGDPDDPTQGTF